MKLNLIQHNESSINAVYIYSNFLNDSELNFCKNKIDSLVTLDNSLQYKTNVKAKMTGWNAVMEEPEMKPIIAKIVDTVVNTYRLRSPHHGEGLQVTMKDCWGMKHSFKDYTAHHWHGINGFSGGLFLDVPTDDTDMYFQDFHRKVTLQSNMLVFFLASTKHSVSEHTLKEKDRLSMAFNINIERINNE